jgi:GH24 family phage-related lysozyme (muramidase)
MPYTLGTAALACGANKSTILRSIKAGKIAAIRDEHGQWQIEPAELHRVYPGDHNATAGATRRNQ